MAKLLICGNCGLRRTVACVQVDVLPLEEFKQDYLPADSHHQDPVYIERVSLRDALNKGDRLESLMGSIELVEPTFQV